MPPACPGPRDAATRPRHRRGTWKTTEWTSGPRLASAWTSKSRSSPTARDHSVRRRLSRPRLAGLHGCGDGYGLGLLTADPPRTRWTRWMGWAGGGRTRRNRPTHTNCVGRCAAGHGLYPGAAALHDGVRPLRRAVVEQRVRTGGNAVLCRVRRSVSGGSEWSRAVPSLTHSLTQRRSARRMSFFWMLGWHRLAV